MCGSRNFFRSSAATCVAVALCLWLAAGAKPAAAAAVDGIRALVHDSVITIWEVEARTFQDGRRLWEQYQNQPTVLEAKVSEVRSNNLAQLIDQQMILHEFQSMNVPPSVLDSEV